METRTDVLDSRAYDALFDAAVAIEEGLDRIDAAPLGWTAVQLPGLPPVSLAFLFEHLSAEFERILQTEGANAK